MAANDGFTGTVTSGTGATYQVALDGGGTVTVTQLQIDATETIPAGTRVLVVQMSGGYFMQVPVFT